MAAEAISNSQGLRGGHRATHVAFLTEKKTFQLLGSGMCGGAIYGWN